MPSLRTTLGSRYARLTALSWRVFEWLPSAAARTTILVLFTIWLVYLLYLRLWQPLASAKELPDEVSATEITVELPLLQSLLTEQQARKAHVPELIVPPGLFRP